MGLILRCLDIINNFRNLLWRNDFMLCLKLFIMKIIYCIIGLYYWSLFYSLYSIIYVFRSDYLCVKYNIFFLLEMKSIFCYGY